MKSTVWLIGASRMAEDYVHVLKNLDCVFSVIGRDEQRAVSFQQKTGYPAMSGGLSQYLSQQPTIPDFAIVSVGIEQLAIVTQELLEYGVKQILVEKPAGLTRKEIKGIAELARKCQAKVFLAYNRRFYESVRKAKEMIAQDQGVTSFHFEITEWSHIIQDLPTSKEIKEKWFLGNSSHVVDLAFFLGGEPQQLESFTSGSLNWHSSASIFVGSGISHSGALFSYQANWAAPGRWSVEFLTEKKHRLIFRPLEKLQIQKLGSITTDFVELADQLDQEYKPGLFRQVEAFLSGDHSAFCTIAEQAQRVDHYYKMANYSDAT